MEKKIIQEYISKYFNISEIKLSIYSKIKILFYFFQNLKLIST